jgi:c-di-GMP-binding flagellar brake protein YcgR
MIVEREQKRRHPRMECSGSASLHLLDEELELRGRILDLSLEGCLLVLEEPAGLQEGAVVELSFSARQLPFRVVAQVKVKRNTITIGFQFLKISRRGTCQLGELIRASFATARHSTPGCQLGELIQELSDERLQKMPGSRHRAGGSGI